MRRILTYFFFSVLLVACHAPVDKGQETALNKELDADVSGVREKQAEGANDNVSKVPNGIDSSSCPTFFKVCKYNAHECYVKLCFKSDETVEDDWQNLHAKCDSTIIDNEEMRRQRVPKNEADRVLEIHGIRDARIYRTSGSVIPTSFVRVEYFEDPISGSFTAVFQSDDSLSTDSNLYAVLPGSIDSFNFKNGDWNFVTVGNEATEDSVLGLVNSTYSTQWFFQTQDKTSSFSLSHSSYSTSISSEFLSLGSTYDNMYEIRDFPVSMANVIRAFPTHYFLENWPVWMIEISVPETDLIFFQAVVSVSENQLDISNGGKLCGK